MPPLIKKIVITGGPCAGKTTALSWIQNAFSQRGWRVLIVPETATELISGGVAPWTCGTNRDYQYGHVQLQKVKEDIFYRAALTMPVERVLLVYDRGELDNKAYMTPEEFRDILAQLGLDEMELRDSYDAVFHLETAAKGAEDAYTLANNQARYETAQEACALDDRIIAAWTGHPHLRVIGNETDFDVKLRRLMAEISSAIGEEEHYEIERKFLIAFPDIAWLESQPNCHRVEIIQTYLRTEEGIESRVRQRGENGRFLYYETTKKPISGMKRVETERRLTEKEYLSLLMNADTRRRQLRKTRFCYTYGKQSFEIDVYPFWQKQAIVEIELHAEDDPIFFPPELRVIREVTDDPAYKNAALATHIPEEETPQDG